MGGTIRFSENLRWMVRGWIFERFIMRVADSIISTSEVNTEIQVGLTHSGIHLDLIEDSQVRDLLIIAIESTARTEMQSFIRSQQDDADSERQYLHSIEQLLAMVQSMRQK